MTVQISIFDLDRTLTRRPTYSLFLASAAARHQPLRLLFIPVVIGAMVLHKAGALSRKSLKELMQRLMLGRQINATRLEALVARFVDQLVTDGLYAAGQARLAEDRAQGRRLVLATAAPDYYARAVAARLGIEDTICTRCGRSGDQMLARIDGANCYGRDKLAAIENWLKQQGLERRQAHVRFYSDDRSDLPIFEWADEPIVVNARRPLRALAAQRGWAIMDWRSPDRALST